MICFISLPTDKVVRGMVLRTRVVRVVRVLVRECGVICSARTGEEPSHTADDPLHQLIRPQVLHPPGICTCDGVTERKPSASAGS